MTRAMTAERMPLEILLDFDKRILWRGLDAMPQDRHMPRPNDQENALVWSHSDPLKVRKDAQISVTPGCRPIYAGILVGYPHFKPVHEIGSVSLQNAGLCVAS